MNSVDYKTLAQRIRLARIEQKITLRDLAQKTGISHSTINRIEKGLAEPSDAMIEKFKNKLNFKLVRDKKCIAGFNETQTGLFKSVLYADYSTARIYAKTLYDNRLTYETCTCFTDYYLNMLFYAQHAEKMPHIIDEYHQKLSILQPGMSAVQQSLFRLESAVYYFRKGDIARALKLLDTQIDYHFYHDFLRSLIHYQRGIIYAQHYQTYKQAVGMLDIAQSGFQRQNNFNRVIQVKIIKQALFVYMNRFDDFLELYQDTLQYAKIKGEPNMYRMTQMNRVRYCLAINDYQATLDMLNFIPQDLAGYDFLKIYTLYQLAFNVETLYLIQAHKAKAIPKASSADYCIDAIDHALRHGRDGHYVALLQAFAEAAFNQGDYMIIKIAYELLSDALVEKRRYKEAHHYSERILEVIRQMMR